MTKFGMKLKIGEKSDFQLIWRSFRHQFQVRIRPPPLCRSSSISSPERKAPLRLSRRPSPRWRGQFQAQCERIDHEGFRPLTGLDRKTERSHFTNRFDGNKQVRPFAVALTRIHDALLDCGSSEVAMTSPSRVSGFKTNWATTFSKRQLSISRNALTEVYGLRQMAKVPSRAVLG